MANTKSACKRINTSERNKIRNKAYKSSIKTLIKKALVSINSLNDTNIDLVKDLISRSYSKIDKAVQKKILHPNNGDSKKSFLIRKFKLQAKYLTITT
nr:ribosomal protein S20 [Cryptomonas borealis]